jgi:hypothetical protein
MSLEGNLPENPAESRGENSPECLPMGWVESLPSAGGRLAGEWLTSRRLASYIIFRHCGSAHDDVGLAAIAVGRRVRSYGTVALSICGGQTVLDHNSAAHLSAPRLPPPWPLPIHRETR